MLDRTPAEAYRHDVDPVQRALNNITVGRLFLAHRQSGLVANAPLNVSMNGGAPSPLQRPGSSPLFVKLDFRVVIEPLIIEQNRFQCRQIAYWYAILDGSGEEIVAYHWTPDVNSPERPFPHLHVGIGMLGERSLFVRDVHKLHIPTSLIAVQQIVRFAIQELGVSVRPGLDRNRVLDQLDESMHFS
jgi:hypothetical protein